MTSSPREDKRKRHRWIGPIAAGHTPKGWLWEGWVCERCGVVVTRPPSSYQVLSWAHEYGGDWGDGPVPECRKKEGITVPQTMTKTITQYEDDRDFLNWLQAHAAKKDAEITKAQMSRFMTLYGANPEAFTIGDLVPVNSEMIQFGLYEARRLLVPWDDLDPGIRAVVRWLVFEGFHTTDSGDGRSKDAEARVIDHPHVVIRVQNRNDLIETALRLRTLLEGRAIEIGTYGEGKEDVPTIEATYSVGDDVSTVVLMNVDDAAAGLDRHWTGSKCGLLTDLDTVDYVVGDSEPCVICDHEGCVATVVLKTAPHVLTSSATKPLEVNMAVLHRRRDLFGVITELGPQANAKGDIVPSARVKWDWPMKADLDPEWVPVDQLERRAPYYPGDGGT